MMDWSDAIAMLEKQGGAAAPLRGAIAQDLKSRGCQVSGITQKMMAITFPSNVVVGWEFNQTLQTFHFAVDHAHLLPKRNVTTRKHSGRRSLKLGYEGPAVEIRTTDDLRVLEPLTGNLTERTLDAWVQRFLAMFPGFTTFPAMHPKFEAEERSGPDARKQATLELAMSERAKVTDAASALVAADRIVQASHIFTQSKMIFRTMKERIGSPPETILPLFSNVPSGQEFSDFINETGEFAVSTARGKPDPTQYLTAANALLMFLHAETWIEINQTRRRKAMMALFAEQAPNPHSHEDCVEADLRLGRTVLDGLQARGLEPRDMIDVQGFVWRVLGEDEISDLQIDEKPAGSFPSQEVNMTTLNTILYGPPGTGKTYETASRAVEICDGSVPNNRKTVMARYRELIEANRIDFVTFHQSYGYEEFVEGLRPTNGGEEDETEGPAGFSLSVRDGILKTIAQRAALPSISENDRIDPETTQVFKMSLGHTHQRDQNYLREECFDNSYVLLGWGGEVDWSAPEFDDPEAIKDHWRQYKDDAAIRGSDPNIVQVTRLRSVMQVGDLVLVSNGNAYIQAIGLVSGPYEYVERERDHYYHKRAVEWLWIDRDGKGADASEFYQRNITQRTLYELNHDKVRWANLISRIQPGNGQNPMPNYVLIIDEVNRANISKVLGEMITLLEEDKRAGAANALEVTLPYSGENFSLPSNLHIVGTMNTADRSIAMLDTALRRRFTFEHLEPKPDLLDQTVADVSLASALQAINDRLEYMLGPDHLIGHAYFMGKTKRAEIDAVMSHKIIPLLREYFHEDLDRVRAILGGTDGFIQREALTPPPGFDDAYGARFRFTDTFDGGYSDQAWRDLVGRSAPEEVPTE
ncbi:MAG TPA: hypothetical protein DEO85_03240 [Maritimibacter sp.]|nr:hypothetical protein [Maritimibacter sp.]